MRVLGEQESYGDIGGDFTGIAKALRLNDEALARVGDSAKNLIWGIWDVEAET